MISNDNDKLQAWENHCKVLSNIKFLWDLHNISNRQPIQGTSLYELKLMTETASSKMKILQAVGPSGTVLEMIKIAVGNIVLE